MDIFNEDLNSGITFAPGNISKEIIESKSLSIVGEVNDGFLCPLETYIKSKAISDVATSICKEIKELAIDEASKYSSEDTVLGVGFSTKNLASTYDFSHDAEWIEINVEISELKAKIKEHEGKMILAMNYSEMIDDDGVVVIPAKVKKAGGTTLAISIPKS